MEENSNKKKVSKWKLFLIIFIIGNITFYFQERSKWICDGQPYPEAKEWLVPANMMMLYNFYLTKLPFVDEKSVIVKPMFMLQDYFVSKWQENLPDDDAEKYLGWYMFYYGTHIAQNLKPSVIMYNQGVYSFDEVRIFLDKIFESIIKLSEYEAKDKEFIQMRYNAFQTLTYIYLQNAMAYWYDENLGIINYDLMGRSHSKLQGFIKLYEQIKEIESYYKFNYPSIYSIMNRETIFNLKKESLLSRRILELLYETKEYRYMTNFCNKDLNPYLNTHLTTKLQLIELEKQGKDIGTNVFKNTDVRINIICKNKFE